MDPIVTYWDDEDVAVSSGNPVSFTDIEKGTISSIFKLWIWNDRGQAGADDIVSPKFHAVNGPGDAGAIFAGTNWNSSESMLEARSCAAVGVSADQHTDWAVIGPMDFLSMGSIIAYSAREIEIRLNVPGDADALSLTNFTFRLQY